MSLAELRSDIVVVACAVSAGIHGALVRGHLEDGAAAGLGFAAASALLALVAVWLTRRPDSRPALATAAASFVGLLVSYLLATTTGLPVVHPDRDPVDGLALATKAVEAAGLLAAASLLARPVAVTTPRPEGALR